MLKGTRYRRRRRKPAIEWFCTADASLAPHELFHPVLGLNPGAARLAPARRRGNRELQAQFLGSSHGVAKRILPIRRHVCEALLNDLGRVKRAIEVLQTPNPDALHPQEILLDALLRDIAIHPMPPHARFGAARRYSKT